MKRRPVHLVYLVYLSNFVFPAHPLTSLSVCGARQGCLPRVSSAAYSHGDLCCSQGTAEEWNLLIPALLASCSLRAAQAWLGYTPSPIHDQARLLISRLDQGRHLSKAARVNNENLLNLAMQSAMYSRRQNWLCPRIEDIWHEKDRCYSISRFWFCWTQSHSLSLCKALSPLKGLLKKWCAG